MIDASSVYLITE